MKLVTLRLVEKRLMACSLVWLLDCFSLTHTHAHTHTHTHTHTHVVDAMAHCSPCAAGGNK